MIGIVLISHDDFCVGMQHAAEMIYGDPGGQIKTVGLAKEAPVEEFDAALREAIEETDTGDGVVLLADLAGGTPFNRAAPLAGGTVRLFGGVNLAFLLELLSAREDGAPDYDCICEFGHAGLREFLPVTTEEEELL